jgi:hypothetical protein
MITSTHLLTEAAKRLKIPYTFIDKNQSFLVLHYPGKNHYIINTNLGLISSSEEKIGRDKAYQYQLLEKSSLLPKFKTYIDPASVKYGEFAEFNTNIRILDDIENNFAYPLILKKNQGQEGVNVFKVNNRNELERDIKQIFNLRDSEYDYVLLAQEYIEAKAEYRVVIHNGEIVLAYTKDNADSKYRGNLSPLHYENAKAVELKDAGIQTRLQGVVDTIYGLWPVKYAGIDVIESQNGKLHLIEVNTAPSLAYFVKDNGEEKAIEIYSHVLLDLRELYT